MDTVEPEPRSGCQGTKLSSGRCPSFLVQGVWKLAVISDRVWSSVFNSSPFFHALASKQSCSGRSRVAGTKTLKKEITSLYFWALIPKEGWILLAFFCPPTAWTLSWKYALKSGVTKGDPREMGRDCREGKLQKVIFEVVCELLRSPLSCAYTDLILISMPKMLRTELTNGWLPRLQRDH